MIAKMKNCKCGSSWLGLDNVMRICPNGVRQRKISKTGRRYSVQQKVVSGIVACCRSCGRRVEEHIDTKKAIEAWNEIN